ncbi:hypothetical protein ACQJBY_054952 [Aegilops geniculata]
MVLWMHGVVAEELMDVVASPDSSAYDIWTQLHLLFMDNQPGRAVVLGAEFRNFVQGDLSIAEYSRRLKTLADALEDVGEHISDQALTLQLIRGLNRKFQIMATLLPMQSPFPSFVQARSRLLMEEISANERARLDGRPELPAAALTIGQAPLGGSSADRGPDRGGSSNDKGKGPAASPTSDNRGPRGRGRGGQSSGGGPTGRVAPPGPASQISTDYFAPYGALIPGLPAPRAPWAAPNAAGVLGPRPPAPHQAYGVPGGRPFIERADLGAVQPAVRCSSGALHPAAASRRRAGMVPRHGRYVARRWI